MIQTILAIIGFVALVVIAISLLCVLSRKIFGYHWTNCPNDHDTMARSGFTGKCDKCGASFNYMDGDD